MAAQQPPDEESRRSSRRKTTAMQEPEPENAVLNPRGAAFAIGSRIRARFAGRTRWYPGVVVDAHDDGSYAIHYDDGDEEDHVAPVHIKQDPSKPKWLTTQPLRLWTDAPPAPAAGKSIAKAGPAPSEPLPPSADSAPAATAAQLKAKAVVAPPPADSASVAGNSKPKRRTHHLSCSRRLLRTAHQPLPPSPRRLTWDRPSRCRLRTTR